MLIIVDYGMGNLGSVLSKFERMKVDAAISSDPAEIAAATRLVLPGVGAFDAGMRNLREQGLVDVLNQRVIEDGVPLLGVCLGFQLMTNHSEEGDAEGLGWVDAETKKFDPSMGVRIPHSGWNTVDMTRGSGIWKEIENAERFYFTHSYHVNCSDPDDIAATTDYGCSFVSAIAKKNIFGTQFHPEKSHRQGIQLLLNFTECTKSMIAEEQA